MCPAECGGIYDWEDCSCHVPAAAPPLLSVSAKAQFTLPALPLASQWAACRKRLMLQPLIMYPGIWAQLTQHKHCQWGSKQIFSCVYNYSVCNKHSATKSSIGSMWLIAEMLNFFVPHLSFLPVIHLLVSVCTAGACGVISGARNKARGSSINFSWIRWFTSLWQTAIHDLRKSSIFPFFSTWLGIYHGRSNQELQEIKLEGPCLIMFNQWACIFNQKSIRSWTWFSNSVMCHY